MRRGLPFALEVFAVVALAGCDSSPTTAPVTDIAKATFASSLGINLAAMTRLSDGLYYQDSPAGTGTSPVAGVKATVNYTGYLTNGTVFDSSVGKTPFQFTFGVGQVIAGWDQGLVGMRAGGTRTLIIAPSLGYGANANGPIPANSILVFTVTLVSVP